MTTPEFEKAKSAGSKVARWAKESPDEAFMAIAMLLVLIGTFMGGLLGALVGICGVLSGWRAGTIYGKEKENARLKQRATDLELARKLVQQQGP